MGSHHTEHFDAAINILDGLTVLIKFLPALAKHMLWMLFLLVTGRQHAKLQSSDAFRAYRKFELGG